MTALDNILGTLGRTAVAFSGGVDSTALLHSCLRILGPSRVLAVTADSPSLPRSELQEARDLALRLGAGHKILQTQELENPEYRRNDARRCYFCKSELFSRMEELARKEGFSTLAYGAITDDLQDFRPGAEAAGEFQVRAPLQEAGWGKKEVRDYLRRHGLPVAEKSSFACLASRIPHGTEVTEANLTRVETAEEVLRRMGFRQFRVRHHDSVARIEVGPEEIGRFFSSTGNRCLPELQAAGYEGIFLDLRGYRNPGEGLAEEDEFWQRLPRQEIHGFAALDSLGAADLLQVKQRIGRGSYPRSSLSLALVNEVRPDAIESH